MSIVTTWVVVNPSTLEFVRIYQTKEGEGMVPQHDIDPSWPHAVIPPHLNQYVAKAILDEEGSVVIVRDDDKFDAFVAEIVNNYRRQRNFLLSACDWTVLPDTPLPEAKRAEWIAYRQALRDFPAKVETDVRIDLFAPVPFPVAP